MVELTSYKFEKIAIFFSAFAVCVSLFFEYVLGVIPCKLCLWQRYLFLSIFLLSALSVVTNFQVFILLVLGAFLGIIGVSTYQALVQFGLLSDPCTVPRVLTRQDFWKAINSPLPCSKISASVFGLPFSLINAISSLIIFCSLFTMVSKSRLDFKERI